MMGKNFVDNHAKQQSSPHDNDPGNCDSKISKQQLSLIKSSFFGLRERLKKRYLILLMCMMMNALSYMVRTNINITIVAMVLEDNERVNNTNIHESCPTSLDVTSSNIIDNNLPLSINETFVYDNIKQHYDVSTNDRVFMNNLNLHSLLFRMSNIIIKMVLNYSIGANHFRVQF